MKGALWLCVILFLLLGGFGGFSAVKGAECGEASWYGTESGIRTANGEHFNGRGMTAAHKTLPFNTKVRVTDDMTGHQVVVRINDRGPFIKGRIIDLSSEAADAFRLRGRGHAPVCIEVIK